MNDSNRLEIPPDHFCESLSCDKLMSLNASSDANAKLNFLSVWMSLIENTSQDLSADAFIRLEKEKRSFFNFLKSCLTVEKNRYVIYSARKVLTSLIKAYNSEDFVKLVQQLLGTDGQLELTCTGLQICKCLFSTRNPNHDSIVSQLGCMIAKSLQYLTTKILTDDPMFDQCLLELFSVCVKLAKSASTSTESNQSTMILKLILINGGETINIILFHNFIKEYVKIKLIKFLCVILRKFDMKKNQVLKDEVLNISICLLKKLLSSDILAVLRKNGKSTFIGNSSILNDASSCDVTHIREWTFLCLCLSSCLIHQEGYLDKITAFLLRVDDNVKVLLDKHTVSVLPWLPEISVTFLWLPDIYGDQDDKWIDALILLMEVFPFEKECSSLSNGDLMNQHHWHFLQFVRTFGFDHLVLIDLLTSPETNCLEYIMKYLKYLHATWDGFVSCMSMGYKENVLCGTGNNIDQTNDVAAKIDLSESDSLKFKLVENGKEIKEGTVNIMTEIQHVNRVKMNGLVSDTKNKCTEIMKTVEDKRNGSSLLASSSLLLIADAYDDDNNDDDDDDSIGIDKENDNNKDSNVDNSDDVHNNADNANIIMAAFAKENNTCVHKRDINVSLENDEYDKFQIKRTDTFLDKSQIVSDANGNSQTDKTLKSGEGDISSERKNNKVLELSSSESDAVTERVSVATCSFEGHDLLELEINKDDDDDDVSYDVIDKVMGMLIRTRLQLEKLNDSCLIEFNPLALIKLIESVEELYEND